MQVRLQSSKLLPKLNTDRLSGTQIREEYYTCQNRGTEPQLMVIQFVTYNTPKQRTNKQLIMEANHTLQFKNTAKRSVIYENKPTQYTAALQNSLKESRPKSALLQAVKQQTYFHAENSKKVIDQRRFRQQIHQASSSLLLENRQRKGMQHNTYKSFVTQLSDLATQQGCQVYSGDVLPMMHGYERLRPTSRFDEKIDYLETIYQATEHICSSPPCLVTPGLRYNSIPEKQQNHNIIYKLYKKANEALKTNRLTMIESELKDQRFERELMQLIYSGQLQQKLDLSETESSGFEIDEEEVNLALARNKYLQQKVQDALQNKNNEEVLNAFASMAKIKQTNTAKITVELFSEKESKK